MEDDLSKKNGKRPKKKKGRRPKKMEDDLKKWEMNQSTKINLIGCDTIVNSPSYPLVPISHGSRKKVVWSFTYRVGVQPNQTISCFST
jgi:hypothetical protein